MSLNEGNTNNFHGVSICVSVMFDRRRDLKRRYIQPERRILHWNKLARISLAARMLLSSKTKEKTKKNAGPVSIFSAVRGEEQ